MPFKPPLTIEQLKEITARRKDDPDVHALLWEIRRLHAIVTRADQLQRTIGNSGVTSINIVVTALREQLKDEPVVAEMRALHDDLLGRK